MFKRSCFVLLSLLIVGLAGSARAGSDPSLVGWWTFDEGSGDTAMDSSGNGPDIPLVSTTWEEGWSGTAVHFHKTGYGRDTAFTFSSNAVTLCAWVWHDAFAGSAVERYVTIGGEVAVIRRNGDGRLHFYITVAGAFSHIYVSDVLTEGEWRHVAGTWDGVTQRLYLDGVEIAKLTPSGTLSAGTMVRLSSPDGEPLNGMLDDVRIYNRALSQEEIMVLMNPTALVEAREPVPDDKATDVARDVTLGWTPGGFAATHDVYLGTNFDDVNDASTSDPRGVLVSQGQVDAEYTADEPLEYAQTYYWRVDEVNAAPDSTVFKGKVWSFTVETYAYPITSLTATASAQQPTSPASKTIDGSGLDAFDQHGVDLKTMWVTPGGLPAWIQYTFDKEYKLHELWVWNANSELESFMGFGAKDVAIEYSTDGETWTALENVPQFAQGTGKATYTASTIVDLGEVMAKHVRLTVNTGWGATTMVSLSEVRFFYTPVQAFAPDPTDGAADVGIGATLSWRPGREATSHQVYFGADASAVAEGTVTAETVTEHSYTPADLMLATEYFWKVDEVGDAGAYAGDVWSFTTEEYLIVDDFESYTDNMDAEEAVFQTWIDGYGVDTNGSLVGIDPAVNGTFCETTLVHNGSQSMPFFYDNTGGATSAEAKRTFDPAEDWTVRGIQSLSLYFAGVAGNSGQLYVKVNNTKVAYDGDAADLTRGVWQVWNIDLSTVGSVSSVRSLTIGVEGAGAAGTLYVDDIRLYPRAPEYITPVDPGKTNLVALYALDGNVNDASGKGNNGTVNGTATYVAGMVNQAMQFDGAATYVDCGSGASLNLTDAVTITAWIKMDFTAGDRKIAGNQDGTTGGYKMGLYTDNKVEFEIRTSANASTLTRNVTGGAALEQGVWYHVAGVYSKGQYMRTYVYGNLDRELQTTAVLGSSTGTFKLGREPSSSNYFWLGAMDDVEVYNRVLSQEEILWVMGQRTPVAKPF
ncbi:MAG: LamG-like jellyroll fold domain-containing protein [Phycisphaerales bacterium]